MKHSRLIVSVLFGLMAAAPGLSAQDAQDPTDRAARADLNPGTSGVVGVVMFGGELDLAGGWGTPAPGDDRSLTAEFLMPYPALTEIMLAATVRALDDAGQLDVDRPIGQWVPDLPPLVQAVSLHQLLTHTAGLDDAAPAPGLNWDNLLTELPLSARFTAPGLVYSHSRYSYPLVGKVLERALGASVAEIVRFAVVGPLGMSRTVFDPALAESGLAMGMPASARDQHPEWALPVVYTAGTDVIQFMAAWMGGAIRGAAPGNAAPDFGNGRAVFVDGVWIQDVGGLKDVWRSDAGEGFGTQLRLYPDNATAAFFWGNGQAPANLINAVDADLRFSLGILGMSPAPAARPPQLDGSWVGTYRNGDEMIQIREGADGLVLFDGQAEVPLFRGEDGMTIARPDATRELILRPLSIRDVRFLYKGNRAFMLVPDGMDGDR